MASMDIFNNSAFHITTMTAAINRLPVIPSLLGEGGLNLFTPKPRRTKGVWFEERTGRIALVPTSPRGAPLTSQTRDKRTARAVETPRLADSATLTAAEIDGIRAFGSETELQSVQTEVAELQNMLRRNFALTWEHMRLGAVQGKVLDADGSTLYDWFDFWGVDAPDPIDFELDDAEPKPGALYEKCQLARLAMQRGAQGAWTLGTYPVGLCGDEFWIQLVTHPDAQKTFELQANAGSLAAAQTFLEGFETFRFGGILFIHYIGTDDGTTVAIAEDECSLFPANAPGVFEVALSPGEFFGTVNRPGLPLYSRMVMDPDANGRFDQAAWVKTELYSYPLFYCTAPRMLLNATAS